MQFEIRPFTKRVCPLADLTVGQIFWADVPALPHNSIFMVVGGENVPKVGGYMAAIPLEGGGEGVVMQLSQELKVCPLYQTSKFGVEYQ